MSIPVLSGPQRGQFVLQADGELVLLEGSQVTDAAGQPLVVVNSGTANTSIGTSVRVGTVVSQAPVTVGSKAVVTGDVRSSSTVTLRKQATVTGAVRENVELGTPGEIAWSVVYPSTSSGNVVVKSGTQILTAGRYGNVTVANGATLQLSTGTYFFDSWDVADKANVALDNEAGTVIIYVRDSLRWAGTQTFDGAAADLLVGYLGTRLAFVQSPFQGTLVAPDAALSIGSHGGGTYTGAFFAKDVQVQPAVRVQFARLSDTGPAADELNPIFTPPSGGPVPPLPTDFGANAEEWVAIVGAYIHELLQSGYIGPTIVAPPPTWARADSYTLPTIPTNIVRGPGGLLPLMPQAPFQAQFAPDDPFAPPPSPNHQSWETGPQTFGNATFGGTVEIAAHADANQSRELGFWTHADTIFNMKLTMFDQDIDILTAFATINTATDKLEPDGTAHSFGRAQVSADAAIFGNIYDEVFTTLGVPLQGGFGPETFDFPLPSIPMQIGPFFGLIEPGVALQYGVPVGVTLTESGFATSIRPSAAGVGTLFAGGGFGVGGLLGVVAGFEGSITLAKVEVPLVGTLDWKVNRAPEICEAKLDGSLTVSVKVSVLESNLEFVVSIDTFFGDFEIFSQEISPITDGFVLLDPPPLQLANFNLADFDLDQSQCRFGGIICATVAAANRVASQIPDAASTADANYGQAGCFEQFVYEVPAELVAAECQDIDRCQAAVSGLWKVLDLSVDQCEDVVADTTVFVLTGDDEWVRVENVQYVGVPTPGGACFAQVRFRKLPLPAGVDEFYTFIHVPLRNLTSPDLPGPIAEVRAIRVAVRAFNQERNVRLPVFVSAEASEADL